MFGAIREDIVSFILARAKQVELPAAEYFFRQGERGSSAFLLERGSVSVIKEWQGQEHLLRRLVAGDFFGEVALLDFGARSASVLADRDCGALEITARDLQQVAKLDAEQFGLIYMNLGRELSRRLRDADDRVFRARFEVNEAIDGYTFAVM